MVARELSIGEVSAKPGEKRFGWLNVGENQDSSQILLPVGIINGYKPGPVLYLQAALGGTQLNTIAVARNVLMKTNPMKLSGGIIATLITNYFGFHHDPPVNWSHKDGGYPVHLNRIYPGKPNGSSSERIIHRVFNETVPQSDYVIDIHQMGTMPSVNRVNVRVARKEPSYEESYELARVFGTEFILDEKEEAAGVEGRLAWQSTSRGIPAIDPELSGFRGWDKGTINVGVRGVENIMKHLKMIKGKPKTPTRQIVAKKLQHLRANRGGFIEHVAGLGSVVEENEIISKISNPFGEVLEYIKATEKSVLWALPEYPMLSTGEVAAILGTQLS